MPLQRFSDGDHVRSLVFGRVVPDLEPEDNEFVIHGGDAMSTWIVYDPVMRAHRRQVRVRYLGNKKPKGGPPSYLYDDELERLV